MRWGWAIWRREILSSRSQLLMLWRRPRWRSKLLIPCLCVLIVWALHLILSWWWAWWWCVVVSVLLRGINWRRVGFRILIRVCVGIILPVVIFDRIGIGTGYPGGTPDGILTAETATTGRNKSGKGGVMLVGYDLVCGKTLEKKRGEWNGKGMRWSCRTGGSLTRKGRRTRMHSWQWWLEQPIAPSYRTEHISFSRIHGISTSIFIWNHRKNEPWPCSLPTIAISITVITKQSCQYHAHSYTGEIELTKTHYCLFCSKFL